MTIDKIIIHHSGGLGNNNYASTAHLTPEDIENAHKARWGFRSSIGKYSGYTFVYDPKTRQITQHRAIGEETAHTIGQNFCSIGLCIIGNYNLDRSGIPVDTLEPHTKMDVVNFLIDLCRGEFRGYTVIPGTIININPLRIYPHRFFSSTDCYGSAVDGNYFKDQVRLRFYPSVGELQSTLEKLKEWLLRLQIQVKTLGGSDRGCEGIIKLENNMEEETKEETE